MTQPLNTPPNAQKPAKVELKSQKALYASYQLGNERPKLTEKQRRRIERL